MKALGKQSRLVVALSVSLVAAATVLIVVNASTVVEGEQQKSVTIRNEAYRFEVTVPTSWTFRKVVQPDPDEGMRTGNARFSISVGESEEEPKEWNGIVFNSTGTSDNPQPFVSMYAHDKSDQRPEEFAELLEETIAGFNGTMVSVDREFSVGDAKGYDYNYNLYVQNRYVVLYRNGMRVIIHYFFPASDPTLFEKHAPEVDEVINSMRLR